MCGLVAILGLDRPVDPLALRAAGETLAHRGPDERGYWVGPQCTIGLAHARLSINDPAGGHQPLTDESGRLHAVVAGEFYDFERIRTRLEGEGHRLRSRSDSEILLHLYEDLGLGCVEELRGEFSFVLWDEEARVLVAGRDRFGIKPLFYALSGGLLLIASEVKALFAAGVPARWDVESFEDHLFFFPRLDRTLFAGVRQVPPGHLLRVEGARLDVAPYWDLDYPRGPEQEGNDDQRWITSLASALADATSLRLRADVTVGCFLSGGIDSSSVLGVAASRYDRPIPAFTVSFHGTPYDEEAVAEESALRFGARFHPLRIGYDELGEHFEEAVWHAEILGLNPHGVARYLQSRAVQQAGYRVVLSGEGSDEILAGYGHVRQHLEGAEGPAQTELAVLAGVSARLGFVPAWLRTLAVGRAPFHLLGRDGASGARSPADVYLGLLEQFDLDGQLAGRPAILQSQYLWTRSILPSYILCAERLELAHGVEARLPFLDHRLFEVVREMPLSLLVGRGKEKWVLREAARPYVTDTVYRRAKQPFTAPPGALDPGCHLMQVVGEHLASDALEALPFLDASRVRQLFAELGHLDERLRIALDAVFFMIASACVLQKRFRLTW